MSKIWIKCKQVCGKKLQMSNFNLKIFGNGEEKVNGCLIN